MAASLRDLSENVSFGLYVVESSSCEDRSRGCGILRHERHGAQSAAFREYLTCFLEALGSIDPLPCYGLLTEGWWARAISRRLHGVVQ